MNAPDNAKAQVAAYLQQHETKSLLRFITCGSVDDGKSTLIGRLLQVGGDFGACIEGRCVHQK